MKYKFLFFFAFIFFLFPLSAHADRIWSSGYELQDASSLAKEWDAFLFAASTSIDTSVKRSGEASLKCDVTADSAALLHSYAADLASETHFVRAYVNITTATDALDSIVQIRDSTDVSLVSMRMNADRTLELWDDVGGSQIGPDSIALSTGRWHRIELSFTTDGNSDITSVTGYINGAAFAAGSSLSIAGAAGIPKLGVGCLTTTTATLNFDDIAVNDANGSRQAALPGEGKIVHMQTDGEGDRNDTAMACTVTSEIIPDNGGGVTTYAELVTDNDIIDCAAESAASAGIGYDTTITLVQVGARTRGQAASAHSWQLRAKSASSTTVSSSATVISSASSVVTHDDTQPKTYKLTVYTDPTTGRPWTAAGQYSLDSMQIGVQAIDAAPDVRVSTLWALVEYTESLSRRLRLFEGYTIQLNQGRIIVYPD